MGDKPGSSHVLCVTDASQTAAYSSLLVEPGHAVRVLLPMSLADLRKVSRQNSGRVTVRLGCDETRYADDQYFTEAEAEKIWSVRNIQIDLGRKKFR